MVVKREEGKGALTEVSIVVDTLICCPSQYMPIVDYKIWQYFTSDPIAYNYRVFIIILPFEDCYFDRHGNKTKIPAMLHCLLQIECDSLYKLKN